jgi:hypothetical protein
MANNTVKISEAIACTSPKSTDLMILACSNNSQYVTKKTTVNQLVSNLDYVIVNKSITPANNSATGLLTHQFWFDNNYMYVVVANNIIKRVALSDF